MSEQDGSPPIRAGLISLTAAGQVAGVAPKTVRSWVTAGLLQGWQVGPRLIKVDKDEVLSLIRPLVADAPGGAA